MPSVELAETDILLKLDQIEGPQILQIHLISKWHNEYLKSQNCYGDNSKKWNKEVWQSKWIGEFWNLIKANVRDVSISNHDPV